MSPQWKPGDVVSLDASSHLLGLSEGAAAKRVGAFLREIEAKWGGDGECRLTANYGGIGTLQWLAEAFEAVSHDPKPDEPQGLGAVVEDAEGKWWTRSDPDSTRPWRVSDGSAFNCPWGSITAVRVLSEGVTP